jgi:hypothetical protein
VGGVMASADISAPARHMNRHPELVSGSTGRAALSAQVAWWMLKQVQHDEVFMRHAVPHAGEDLQ